MEQLLEELLDSCQPYTKQGKLADYIPELLKADPNALGIYVMRPDGKRSWPVTAPTSLPFKVSSSPSCCCWP